MSDAGAAKLKTKAKNRGLTPFILVSITSRTIVTAYATANHQARSMERFVIAYPPYLFVQEDHLGSLVIDAAFYRPLLLLDQFRPIGRYVRCPGRKAENKSQ
ncbi:MAG: hypothetical protein U0989_09395, partial [Azonexus sp.]|nr:hypothetical protein [Azonexus sp.]